MNQPTKFEYAASVVARPIIDWSKFHLGYDGTMNRYKHGLHSCDILFSRQAKLTFT